MRPLLGSLALLLAGRAWAGPNLQLLRFNDDFTAQHGECLRFPDRPCLKGMRVGAGPALELSLGGELRWRLASASNAGIVAGSGGHRSDFLQRYTAFANLALGANVRLFGQIVSAQDSGPEPSAVDENRLDLQNLFVEASGSREAARYGARYGIQEMRLGSARLVDVREGPNVRRSFQGLRLSLARPHWTLDVFDVNPRRSLGGVLDDVRNDQVRLRGAYLTHSSAAATWDFYWLRYRDLRSSYLHGPALEERWTLGARSSGTRGRWDWNWEAAVQGGRFGPDRIQAWTLATETGYSLAGWAGTPRIALLMAAASGDADPGDRRLGTFNPMFPRGNYFGEDATLGPRNFLNFQPTLSWRASPRWEIEANVDWFLRQSVADGVYSPAGGLLRAPSGSRARHVATIASLNASFEAGTHASASIAAAHLRPGAFLRDSGMARPINYVELTWHYRY